MWSDMAVALEDLAGVRFLLIPASVSSSNTNSSPNSIKQPNTIPKEYLPQIHGCRDALQVSELFKWLLIRALIFSSYRLRELRS